MTQPYKLCPKCQQPAALDAPTCSRCGRVYRTRFSTAQQTQMVAAPPPLPPPIPSRFAFACSVCGNEQVQKISAICQSGQWSQVGTLQTTSVAFDEYGNSAIGFGGGVQHTQGSTQLAAMLTPPPPPAYYAPGIVTTRIVWIVLTVLFALFTLAFLPSSEEVVSFGSVLFGFGTLACLAGAISTSYKCPTAVQEAQWFHQKAMDAYQQRIERWQQLYYCARCDHVYHPISHQAAPVHAFHGLLG